MKLLRRIWRGIKRIDRATGRIRDTTIKAATRLVKAYRKRNGQRVKAHKRIVSVHYDRHGKRTVKRPSNGKSLPGRIRSKSTSSRSNV